MNPVLLIQLTENDKRIIFALCIVIILLFVIIGLLGSLVVRTMKWQGKKCDSLVSDVVTNRIITTPHQLRKYAAVKNSRCFLKQAWIPLVLMIVATLIIVIRDAVMNNWAYNPFNIDNGFGSLLFVWKLTYNNPEEYTIIFGVKILAKWVLVNEPHFVVEALSSYIAVPLAVVGVLWYLVAAQAYLARTIRSWKLSKTVFEKSLDNYNQNAPQQPENSEPVQ
ncbi:MAG: hypothetical protein IJR08_01605 [Bacilli bacterium]|nr:hypothetical protein [Bacilli bacterium]